jgi:hypothetical protein
VDLLVVQNRILRIGNGATRLEDWLEASRLTAITDADLTLVLMDHAVFPHLLPARRHD